MLETTAISYRIAHRDILSGVSAVFEPGRLHVLLGPNGSGKSSFLRIFSGEWHGYTGMVMYDGINIRHKSKMMLARERAVMSQQPQLSFPISVEEVVLMGRYPHFEFNPNKKDRDICEAVMEEMQLIPFRQRNYLTLSGGEKQRVHFARVLAQVWEHPAEGCRYLFLDEPLASLDMKYQLEFMERTRSLLDHRTVVIAILHDVNLALEYADSLSFLKNGKLYASGPPPAVLTPQLIHDVFDVQASIMENPISGKKLVLFGKG